jgi:hypothetical protein
MSSAPGLLSRDRCCTTPFNGSSVSRIAGTWAQKRIICSLCRPHLKKDIILGTKHPTHRSLSATLAASMAPFSDVERLRHTAILTTVPMLYRTQRWWMASLLTNRMVSEGLQPLVSNPVWALVQFFFSPYLSDQSNSLVAFGKGVIETEILGQRCHSYMVHSRVATLFQISESKILHSTLSCNAWRYKFSLDIYLYNYWLTVGYTYCMGLGFGKKRCFVRSVKSTKTEIERLWRRIYRLWRATNCTHWLLDILSLVELWNLS